MSDKNIQSVISKVQKLLSMVEGSANEHECAAARSAADRLIQEYRLSAADLETKGAPEEAYVRKSVHEGGKRMAWCEVLLAELCAHFGGYFYYSSYRSGGDGGQGRDGSKGVQAYTVVAKESDLAVIEYFYDYLYKEVDRISKQRARGCGMKVALSYRMGMSIGIASQFREMRAATRASAQANSQSSAMVLLDDRAKLAETEAKKQVPSLCKGASISGGRDADARAAGYVEGRRVSINTALPTTSAARLT